MTSPDSVRSFRSSLALAMGIALAAVTMVAGCEPELERVIEILPRETLITHYNARANSIQMLRAKCHITARMAKLDEQGKPIKDKHDTYSVDGNLLLRKPRDLYLVGKAFGDPQFGLHSNSDIYWWWVKPGDSIEFFGSHGGPGVDLFPVRPDLLLEALAIYPLPADMRVFKRGDQMDIIQTQGVELLEHAGGGEQVRVMPYIIQEVSLEREYNDPVEVRLYDTRGEPLLVSELSDYREVDGQRVPMKIVYTFVPVDWTFTLSLKDVSLTREIKDAVFVRRPQGFENTIDLDAEAERRKAN